MHLAILGIFLGLIGGSLFPSMVAAEACREWVAKAVSVQGIVEVRRAGATQWTLVQRDDTFCPGDIIRVKERSRLAIVAQNETVHRLDENTTITITKPEQEQTFLLNLRAGAAYFFSRIPRSLKVITPFVNAGVEGTEFFVKVERDQTFLSVFEGQVAATNTAGSLTLSSGQSAIVKAGQAPVSRVVVRPRDAVQWALHYPPIVDFRPADFPGEAVWQTMVRQSIQFYRKGDLPEAFASIAGAPKDIRDPRFFTYRAALLLTVGRVEEARADIENALKLDPRSSRAFALQAIIAVVQNRKDTALQLATQAVELEPASSVARVALSYAQQARFDLQGALASLKEAVQLPPENALAWARLAELWLSVGELKRALQAAHRAIALNPQVSRTQTVLGFAFLTQIKIRDAKNAFEEAIKLDQAAPLPRLGLGLARIRWGELKAGRGDMEIAASLDPNNSLIRSYLGKAYYEEKRNKLAKEQYATAKELDPKDPTPWFYDAIRKQSVNRPVEALQDLQKSIELNDNRAVYRSRLLLDEDLAARNAALGRIYNDLGFQQRALVEGWESLNVDPSNYSAHRFLSDVYSALPRHEIARVSELLQAQLLQPINITPIQPQLAERELFILSSIGPATPSLNEFNPLFNRNGFALLPSVVVGNNDTWGDEVVFSGIADRLSYSVGQLHYETDGFRDNNDLDQNLYNVFAQLSLTYNTSVQAELRYNDVNDGDRGLRFFPEDFLSTLRQDRTSKTARLGFHHAFAPGSDVIASVIYKDVDTKVRDQDPFFPFKVTLDEAAVLVEGQYLFRSAVVNIISGVGYFTTTNRKQEVTSPLFSPIKDDNDIRYTNLYVYSLINYLQNVTVTLGISASFFDGSAVDRDQVNPKVGLTWTPFPSTTLRAAVFRVLNPGVIVDQTIEPTQVAGFNQFFGTAFEQRFDEGNFPGIDAWRYGVALDHKFSPRVYAGSEFSKRDLKVPGERVDTRTITKVDWHEYLVRSYLYWTPHPWFAISTEYQFERFKRDDSFGFGASTGLGKVDTHRVPLTLSFFHPSGLSARIKATYIDQNGKFAAPVFDPGDPFRSGDDQFWLVDTAIRYRLPKRYGFITFGVENVFDEKFKFQELDPATPTIQHDRLIFGRVTLGF